MTALDIIKAALEHLRVLDPAESATAEDAATCLRQLKSMLDAWQLDPQAVIGLKELTRTPTAGTQSFTIGTGGDISTSMPLRIESAFYRTNGIDTPVCIEQLEDYLAEASKTVQGPPSFIAYERSSVGRVYMYPAADGLSELHLWVMQDVVSGYSSLTTATVLTLPNGYQSALEWCLADEVSSVFSAAPDAVAHVARKAAIARRRLKRSNLRVTELRMPEGVPLGHSFDINAG